MLILNKNVTFLHFFAFFCKKVRFFYTFFKKALAGIKKHRTFVISKAVKITTAANDNKENSFFDIVGTINTAFFLL